MSEKRRTRRERTPRPVNENKGAYVRRSTLMVSVAAALILGLYIGTLIPSFMHSATPVASGGSANSAPQASSEGQSAAHIEEARLAAEKNPQDVQRWIHLGNLYYDARMAADSVMAYTKALEITPNNANVLTDRGTMYRELKKFDLALESFRSASRINPSHEQSLFNAGIVLYFDLGQKAEGKDMWQQLLRINPMAKAPNGQLLKDMINELP